MKLTVCIGLLCASRVVYAGCCSVWLSNTAFAYWPAQQAFVVSQFKSDDCADDAPQFVQWTVLDRQLRVMGSISRGGRIKPEKRAAAPDLSPLAAALKKARPKHWQTATPAPAGLEMLKKVKCQAGAQLVDKEQGLVRVFVDDPSIRAKLPIATVSVMPDCRSEDRYEMACSAQVQGSPSLGCFDSKQGQVVEVHASFENECGGTFERPLVLVNAAGVTAARENILGMRALRAKDYARARAHLEEALKAQLDHPVANYNMACSLALGGRPFSEGRRHLERALTDESRSKTLRQIKRDPDLKAWRADAAFQKWLAEAARPNRKRVTGP